MDEQTLERMVVRSFSSIRHRETILFSAAALFLSGLLWLCSRALLGQVGTVFYLPFLVLSFSVALLPLLALISPLSLFVLSYRKQEAPLSVLEACSLTWKPSLALFVQGIIFLVLEVVLATLLLLWSFFETVPVLGQVVHIFSSWIPMLVSFFMVIGLFLHILLACFLGTTLVVHPVHAKGASWSDLLQAFATQWFVRLKIYFFGFFPILFLLTFLTGWGALGYVSYSEFCASVFRLGVFSFVFAPFFVFLVHMAVEAERYIIWRLRNKS